ncbi:Holin-like protein OS=Ureibacillus acetophenoni OX=614649 GN=SAMN05877842_101325 PE=4 SV=1 [Ureibacillus acetophenoni]
MPKMMRIIRTVLQIIILYIFHYIGVFIVEFTNLPLPPSVVGFILLFICLLMNWIKVEMIRDGASFLIGFMLLFYIPPVIGIIEYPQLISVNGMILIGAVIISTLFTIYLTSMLSQIIEKKEINSRNKKISEAKEEGENV